MFKSSIMFNGHQYSGEDWNPISTLPCGEEVIVHGKFKGEHFIAQLIVDEEGNRTIIDNNVDYGRQTPEELGEWLWAVKFGELKHWQPVEEDEPEECEECIVETIKKSIYEFTCRTGMHPNHLMLSEDALSQMLDCVNAPHLSLEFHDGETQHDCKVKIMGLPVRLVIGEGVVAPAIL